MGQKDKDMQEQLDAIMKELKEAKQQTASTIAINQGKSSFTFPSFLKIGLKKWSWKLGLFLAALLIIGALIGSGLSFLFSGSKAEIEKGSFVEQMKDLSSLATSQAYVKAVIEKEDNQLFGYEIKKNIPGTKRKLFLIIPGTVTAGVDLKQLEQKDMKINQSERKVTVTLPRATMIQEPSLDLENAQTFSIEGIFRNEVNWDEAYDLAEEAKDQIEKEAITQGILQRAEKNAEKTLKEFFKQFDYKMEVKYQD
ncbi:DUF4230 domain-containing protein [Bacillus massilinigeriensis]|uniref:DUF4230 domain-containing protein n=1 Tax=Bacillus massilionigeriensis TaxID=1805475 RepID=UPI00096B0984|nr:DUF4230 domain-containing protein [Bacillus massilionigeriensis]